MENFQVGFARIDVTPPLGTPIAGYYHKRIADGILDPLLATAVAVSDGTETAVVVSLDAIGIAQDECDKLRNIVAERNQIPYEAVFIACTHTHTGPVLYSRNLNECDDTVNSMLFRRVSDAVTLAIADLKPAKLSRARNILKDIAFVRRFRMKNGEIQTNPGYSNPDIVEAVGTPDETVQLVRITREDADEILIVNFQVHPDTIAGCKYSADFPKFVRDTLESALPNVKCMYLNGAQGDTNHYDVRLPKDTAYKSYEWPKHMGRAIAGAVLQVYGKAEPVKAGKVSYIQRSIMVPLNRVDASKVSASEEIIKLHESGRDAELSCGKSDVVTVVAEAYRIVRLANSPEKYPLYMTAISFGDIAITGIPGEPFTEIGRSIKRDSKFGMTIVCCCSNGCEAYYPMRSAYEEGGYEARSSSFKAGVAEQIIESSLSILNEIKD